MKNKHEATLIDIIKYPIITDKAIRSIEENQYHFAVHKNAAKEEIKEAIEYLFQVKVKGVNTQNPPAKKRRIGRFIGYKRTYKKAIVTLWPGNSINLFPNV